MKRTIATFICIALLKMVNAQNFSNAVEYLNYIGKEYKTISEGILSYTSAVAHGKSARKVEKKRKEMIGNISDAKTKISKMPAFNGSTALRDSVMTVLSIEYNIINEDYANIVNLEEVAEQSYDAMEAYLLAQDLAGEKLDQAGDRLDVVQDQFIKDNNITVTESDKNNEVLQKMKKLSEVNSYHRKIYLIFFKSYKQEMYLIDAMNKNDLNAMEQNKNALSEVATEGLAKLDTMKSFNSDMTLLKACKELLTFYKDEAENGMPILIDFLLKNENFTKIKTAFEAKKDKEKTQKDVDEFNKAVNEVNDGAKKYNDTNNKLNNDRKKYLDGYNNTSTKFMDRHVPHFSK